eukprot:549852-Amphidinium_carterae.1
MSQIFWVPMKRTFTVKDRLPTERDERSAMYRRCATADGSPASGQQKSFTKAQRVSEDMHVHKKVSRYSDALELLPQMERWTIGTASFNSSLGTCYDFSPSNCPHPDKTRANQKNSIALEEGVLEYLIYGPRLKDMDAIKALGKEEPAANENPYSCP